MSDRIPSLTRRKFLQGGFGALGVGALDSSRPGASYGLADTTADIRLEQVVIKIHDLPKDFENYRIGFLSDLHLGVNIPDEWIADSIRMVSEAKVDLLLLGGDYIAINDSVLSRSLATGRNKRLSAFAYSDQPDVVFPLLAAMLKDFPCPDGMCAVFGNHDLWVAPLLCRRSFSEAKIRFLVNETATIVRGSSRLVVVGFDDYWNGVPRWPKSVPPEVSQDEVRIALSHNPDQLSVLLDMTVMRFSLGLSGHTHGGQIAFPAVGPVFFNVRDVNLASGLYKHPSGSITYTSRGLGVVEIPYRINCPAEATVIELKGA